MAIRATLPEARKYKELLDSLTAAEGAAASRAPPTSVDASTMTSASGGRKSTAQSSAPSVSSPLVAAIDVDSAKEIKERQEEKARQLILRDLLHPKASPSPLDAPVGGHRGSSALQRSPLPAVASVGAAATTSSSLSSPLSASLRGRRIDEGETVPRTAAADSTDEYHGRRSYQPRPESAGPHPLASTNSARPPFAGVSVYSRDAREAANVALTNTRPSTVGAVPYASTWTLGGRPIPSPTANTALNASYGYSRGGIHGSGSANNGGGRPRNLPTLSSGVITSSPPPQSNAAGSSEDGANEPAFVSVSPNSVFKKHPAISSQQKKRVAAEAEDISVSTLQQLLIDQRNALRQEAEVFAVHKKEKAVAIESMIPHDEAEAREKERIAAKLANHRAKHASDCTKRKKGDTIPLLGSTASAASAYVKPENTLQQRRLKEETEARKAAAKLERKKLKKRLRKREEIMQKRRQKNEEDGGDNADAAAANGRATTDTAEDEEVGTNRRTSPVMSNPVAAYFSQPNTYFYKEKAQQQQQQPKSLTEQFFGDKVRKIRAERSVGGGGGGEEPYSVYDDRARRDEEAGRGRSVVRHDKMKDAPVDVFAVAITNPGKVSLKAMLGVKTASDVLGLNSKELEDDFDDDEDDDGNYDDISTSSSDAEESEETEEQRTAREAAAKELEERQEKGRLAPFSLVDEYVEDAHQKDISLRLKHFGVRESEGFVSTIFGYSPSRQRLAAHSPLARATLKTPLSASDVSLSASSGTKAVNTALAAVSEKPAPSDSSNILQNLISDQSRAVTTPTASSQQGAISNKSVIVTGGIPSDVVGRKTPNGFSVVLKHKNVLEQPTHAPSTTAAYLPTLRQPQPTLEAALSSKCPAIYYSPPSLPMVEEVQAKAGDGVMSVNAMRNKAISAAIIDDYKSDRRRTNRTLKDEDDSAALGRKEEVLEVEAHQQGHQGTTVSEDIHLRNGSLSHAANNGETLSVDVSDIRRDSEAITHVTHQSLAHDVAATTSSSSSCLPHPDVSAVGPSSTHQSKAPRGGEQQESKLAAIDAAPKASPEAEGSSDGLYTSLPPSRSALGYSTVDSRPRPRTSDDPFKVIDLTDMPRNDEDDDLFPKAPEMDDDEGSEGSDDEYYDESENKGDLVVDGDGGGADPSRPILENHPDAPRDPTKTDLEHLSLEVKTYELEDELKSVQEAHRSLLQSREAITALRTASRGRQEGLVSELTVVEKELQEVINRAAPIYREQRKKLEAEEKRNDPRRTVKPKKSAEAVWSGEHHSLEQDLADNQQLIINREKERAELATREGYYAMRTEALRRLELTIEPSSRTVIANVESAAFSVLVAICKEALLQETLDRRTIVREQRDHFRSLVSLVAAERSRAQCAVWLPSMLKPHERYDKHMLPVNPLRPSTVATASGGADPSTKPSLAVLSVEAITGGNRKKSVDFREKPEVTAFSSDQPATSVSPLRPHTALTYEEENNKRKKELFEAAAEAHRQRLRKGWAEEQADREALLKLQRDKLQWKQEKRLLKKAFFEACAAADMLPSDVEMIGEDGAIASIRPSTSPSPAMEKAAVVAPPSSPPVDESGTDNVSAASRSFFNPTAGSPLRSREDPIVRVNQTKSATKPTAAGRVGEQPTPPGGDTSVNNNAGNETTNSNLKSIFMASCSGEGAVDTSYSSRPATAVTDADDFVMQLTTSGISSSPLKTGVAASSPANENTSALLTAEGDYQSFDQRAATPATPAFAFRNRVGGSEKPTTLNKTIPTTPRRQEVLRLRQRLEYVQWAIDDVEQKEESLKKKIFAKGPRKSDLGTASTMASQEQKEEVGSTRND